MYSLAYGDQPALVCELVDWARACGFPVIAAGKGTKYLPRYRASTPATVWQDYGIAPEDAAKGGMNPQMFNSFLDGTKSAIEMASVANATGLDAPAGGLSFPPCGADELATVLRPRERGGVLERAGQVEVVSSLRRDGAPVPRDLRWGVYVVVEAPSDYAARCFGEYGVVTDPPAGTRRSTGRRTSSASSSGSPWRRSGSGASRPARPGPGPRMRSRPRSATSPPASRSTGRAGSRSTGSSSRRGSRGGSAASRSASRTASGSRGR